MVEHPKKHSRIALLSIFVGIWIFIMAHKTTSFSVGLISSLPNGTAAPDDDAGNTEPEEPRHDGDFFVKPDPLYIEGEELGKVLNAIPLPVVRDVEQLKKCGDVSKCVTGIINTRGRFDAVEKQFKEVDESPYKDMKFIVVTDLLPEDKEFYRPFVSDIRHRKNVELKIVKFNDSNDSLGIGRGRNLALSYVKTPYFLQLDDDFQWAHNNVCQATKARFKTVDRTSYYTLSVTLELPNSRLVKYLIYLKLRTQPWSEER
eukprot:sb/3468485/